MLLDHFDKSQKFLGRKMSVTTEFKRKSISLQLPSDRGGQHPFDGEHVIKGWKLKPKQDLTVSTV